MAIEANKSGPSNAHMIYIPIIVFTIICPALVGLRVWSRLRKGGILGMDDHLIFASLAFALASSGVMIASCQYGFGQKVSNLTAENKINALKFYWVCQITYKMCINLTKMSILMLYVRIFGNVRWFKWICFFLLTCVCGYCIASVVATIFQCSPVPRAFNKLITGTCIDSEKFWYANAGFSIATDLVVLIIPMPLVYQLQIPKVQKSALVLVFALGSFVVITSCLRITTINIAASTTDTTYDIASTMWTMIEMNIAIVCACLPMIRPLIVKIFPRLMQKSSSNRNKYGLSGATGPNGQFGSKGYFSSHSQDPGEPSDWTRVEGKDGIHMTTIRKGDQSSEEYILHEDKANQQQQQQATALATSPENRTGVLGGAAGGSRGEGAGNGMMGMPGIQKTVQYSVEYGAKEKGPNEWA